MANKGKDIAASKGKLERLPQAMPFGDAQRLFDDFFNSRWLRPFGWERPFELPSVGPNVDVIDRDDEVVVRAEVPGYRKEDIEISVSDSLLTLKGEVRREEKEEEGDYFRSEISRQAFSRSLVLPAEVDDAKAKATIKDGILELTLPKREKSKRRSIAIT
ncbi:MAG TPA: Hsp20/alpha crystallin family protein [Burkholderiales bacterium]|nr:Hsp20/alpha crystallin family protein [Burkholderiales bacterium]